MMKVAERWLPVVGAEGIYEISDRGRVRSLQWQGGRRPRPLLLKPRPVQGYLFVCLSMVDGKKWFVHTMVLTAFVGPRPEGLLGRHLNGKLKDNSLGNLRWGTQAENMADSMAHGTFALGEKNGQSVLTEAQARAILVANQPQARLSARYGVSIKTISNIRTRKAWKHLAA